MFNILLTPHTSCHRIKYFCLFRQVWLHITPDLFPLLLIVIDEQHWRIQCIRKTCTHFYICRVLFCCVVVSVDLIPPTSLAPSLWYGCPIARKGSPMLRVKRSQESTSYTWYSHDGTTQKATWWCGGKVSWYYNHAIVTNTTTKPASL